MANTTQGDTNSSGKIDRVAKHELLGVDGSVVDNEEDAVGIRYTLLENGQVFDWLTTEANEDELRMFAIFGAKTRATNITSQVRNSKEGGGADDQIAAVRDTFGMVRDEKKWIDRTREGGIRINLDALAQAFSQVMNESGKTMKNGQPFSAEAVKPRFEQDKALVSQARSNPAVAAAYAAIVGRTVATVDSLADAI